ncbi:MAG: UDP-glucose 4-epimerase, partial [uncultured Acidimicrobiales bacterium]
DDRGRGGRGGTQLVGDEGDRHRGRGLHRQHPGGAPRAGGGRGHRAHPLRPARPPGLARPRGPPRGPRPPRGRPRPAAGARGGRGQRGRVPPRGADRHPLQLRGARQLRAGQRAGHPERRPRLWHGRGRQDGPHVDQRDVRDRTHRPHRRGPPAPAAVPVLGQQDRRRHDGAVVPPRLRAAGGGRAAVQHLRSTAEHAGGHPDDPQPAPRRCRDDQPGFDDAHAGLQLRRRHGGRLPRRGRLRPGRRRGGEHRLGAGDQHRRPRAHARRGHRQQRRGGGGRDQAPPCGQRGRAPAVRQHPGPGVGRLAARGQPGGGTGEDLGLGEGQPVPPPHRRLRHL